MRYAAPPHHGQRRPCRTDRAGCLCPRPVRRPARFFHDEAHVFVERSLSMAFGSFNSSGAQAPMAEVNTTSLIDVTTMLMIIFIIYEQAVF